MHVENVITEGHGKVYSHVMSKWVTRSTETITKASMKLQDTLIYGFAWTESVYKDFFNPLVK